MEEENLYIPMGLKEDDEYWQDSKKRVYSGNRHGCDIDSN